MGGKVGGAGIAGESVAENTGCKVEWLKKGTECVSALGFFFGAG
jgi:hypothetical protein